DGAMHGGAMGADGDAQRFAFVGSDVTVDVAANALRLRDLSLGEADRRLIWLGSAVRLFWQPRFQRGWNAGPHRGLFLHLVGIGEVPEQLILEHAAGLRVH